MRALILILALGLIAADKGDLPDGSADGLSAETLAAHIRPLRPAADAPFAAMQLQAEAKAAMDKRDYARAAEAYQSILHLDPTQDAARLALAEIALIGKQPDKADQILGTISAPALRLRIDFELDRLHDVESQLRAGFEQTQDPRLLNLLGQWLESQDRGQEARAIFAQADPFQSQGLSDNNIGLSYLREGALTLAQDAFNRAVKKNPSEPRFDTHRRLCALMRGRYVEGLDGLGPAEAAPLLRDAGLSAMRRGETRLAHLLLDRASNLSVRHDPALAQLITQLEDQRSNPDKDAQ